MMTYEEVQRLREESNEARNRYRKGCVDFLYDLLRDVGFSNKTVRLKEKNILGQIRVEENRGSSLYPYEYKFHPLTKSGAVSMNSKYVYFRGYKDLRNDLLELFELAG